jgi:hypothetical protein
MHESAAAVTTMPDPPPTVRDLPAPHRAAIATLFREILAAEGELAHLYAGFADRTTVAHLRSGLEELTRAKETQVAALTRLAPELLEDGTRGAAEPSRPGRPDADFSQRADLFGHAFQAERILEGAYRELVVLLGHQAVKTEVARLAGASAQHRSRLRTLYVWYS